MLVFVHADGMLTAKAYHSLDGVLCPPPYRVLWLLYLNGAYVLEGERLDLLFTKIARHRQGRIHCVDPSFHPDPKQGWAVYSIEQRSPSDMVAELEE
jgi:hypothetical protein